MAAGIIGHVGEFNGNLNDWVVYAERLEQYFFANKIEEAKVKVATLISLIGDTTYKLLRDLCHPSLPKDKTYEELKELLKKQFSPQVSKWRERIKFYEARQQRSETVSEWYARIKNLAVNCEFGGSLESVLKDKLVAGLQKGKILDRLCEEDTEKTLKEIVELALKKETGYKEEEVSHIEKSRCPPQRKWEEHRARRASTQQRERTSRRTQFGSMRQNWGRRPETPNGTKERNSNDRKGYVSQNRMLCWSIY